MRAILPAVTAPTLLLVDEADPDDRAIADQVAARMQRATVEALPRASSSSGVRDYLRPRLDAIRRFVGVEPIQAAATILSTVLFTDIVGSTQLQTRLGDRGWKTLVERHHAIVRQALHDWDGFENDTAGDGFYATFRGPSKPSAAPSRSASKSDHSGSKSAPAYTPASASSSRANAPASPSRRARASPRRPALASTRVPDRQRPRARQWHQLRTRR